MWLKSLVACLVLANVGYFLWTRGVAKPSDTPAQGDPAGVLRLASESRAERAVSPAAAANAAAVSANAARVDSGSSAASGSVVGSAGGMGALLGIVKRCISVGPFSDVSEAAHAATTLRAGGYDPRQRVADGEVWAGVWVYLQLPASRAAGERILAKLKAGGIDDTLEMPGPNEGSVISLGLYSDSKRAQARVAQAQALGFNPGVADRKRTGNVYWIDIDLKPTDSVLNPADLQGDAGRIVRLEVKGCPLSGAAP